MSYLGAGADWRKRNYLIEPDVLACAETGAVSRISDAAFDARWPGGVIEFDEYAIGTPQPTYTPTQYGAVGGFQPHVVTGPFLLNQAYAAFPFVEGVVANPVAMDLSGGVAVIANDTARPVGAQTCLEGTPIALGTGALAFEFTEADFTTNKPVVGVSINVGFCNVIGTIRVRAYGSDATLLGTWFNETAGGYENFNLNRDSDVPLISALVIDSNDPAGYSISQVRFSNECA